MATRRKVAVEKISGEVARDIAVSGVALRYRHDGWTEARRTRFMQTLAMTGCVRDACRVAGMSNVSAYRLRRKSPEFAAAWDRALDHASLSLKAAAWARAVIGVEEPIVHGGKIVGMRRKFSDTLLRMLLQAADPETFGRKGAGENISRREEIEADAAAGRATRRKRLIAVLVDMNRRLGGDQ